MRSRGGQAVVRTLERLGTAPFWSPPRARGMVSCGAGDNGVPHIGHAACRSREARGSQRTRLVLCRRVHEAAVGAKEDRTRQQPPVWS